MTVVSTALGLLPTIPSDPNSRGRGDYQAGDDFCAEPMLQFVDCSASGRAVPVGGRKRTGNMSEVVERSQNMVYAQLADNVSVKNGEAFGRRSKHTIISPTTPLAEKVTLERFKTQLPLLSQQHR